MTAVLGGPATALNELRNNVLASSIFSTQCALDALTPANQVTYHAYRPDPEGNIAVPTLEMKYPLVVLKFEGLRWEFTIERNCALRQGNIHMLVVDRFRGSDFQDSAALFTNFWGQLIESIISNGTLLATKQITQSQPVIATERRDETSTFKYFSTEFGLVEGAAA